MEVKMEKGKREIVESEKVMRSRRGERKRGREIKREVEDGEEEKSRYGEPG